MRALCTHVHAGVIGGRECHEQLLNNQAWVSDRKSACSCGLAWWSTRVGVCLQAGVDDGVDIRR